MEGVEDEVVALVEIGVSAVDAGIARERERGAGAGLFVGEIEEVTGESVALIVDAVAPGVGRLPGATAGLAAEEKRQGGVGRFALGRAVDVGGRALGPAGDIGGDEATAGGSGGVDGGRPIRGEAVFDAGEIRVGVAGAPVGIEIKGKGEAVERDTCVLGQVGRGEVGTWGTLVRGGGGRDDVVVGEVLPEVIERAVVEEPIGTAEDGAGIGAEGVAGAKAAGKVPVVGGEKGLVSTGGGRGEGSGCLGLDEKGTGRTDVGGDSEIFVSDSEIESETAVGADGVFEECLGLPVAVASVVLGRGPLAGGGETDECGRIVREEVEGDVVKTDLAIPPIGEACPCCGRADRRRRAGCGGR